MAFAFYLGLLVENIAFVNQFVYICIQFQMKLRKIGRRRSCSPKDAEFSRFALLLCRGRKEMYKDLERTCTAIVWLIKSLFR